MDRRIILSFSRLRSNHNYLDLSYREARLQTVNLLILLSSLIEIYGVLYVVRGVMLRRPEVWTLK